MATVITAIHLGNSGTGTERISQVWANSSSISVSNVVARIRSGETFRSGSQSGPIVEVAYRGSTSHIRTEANGTTTDNLLSLPQY